MAEMQGNAGRDEWLRTLYVEAWKQYAHEDNLGVSQSRLYIGVQQTALVAVLALAGSIAISAKPLPADGHPLQWGLAFFGILAIAVGLVSLMFSKHWRNVTDAGRRYLSMRWLTIMAIEELAGLEDIGLAHIEDRYRRFSIPEGGQDSGSGSLRSPKAPSWSGFGTNPYCHCPMTEAGQASIG